MKKVDFSDTLKRMQKNIEENGKAYEDHRKKQEKETAREKEHTFLRNMDIAGLPRIRKGMTLETISPKTDQQKTLIDILKIWDRNKDYRLPYVFGPPGVGKSFVSLAFAIDLVSKGAVGVKYFTMSQFIIKYRDFGKDENIDDLIYPSVLILDDFCSHNITKHVAELIHATIDYRLVNEKPTLITSNVAMNKISSFLYDTGKGYGLSRIMCDAIEDRIFELCSICIFKGKSIRETDAMERIRQASCLPDNNKE